MKKLALLGCTGSIGLSTSQVVRDQRDRFEFQSLAAHSSVDKLWALAEEFDVKHLCLTKPEANDKLKQLATGSGRTVYDNVETHPVMGNMIFVSNELVDPLPQALRFEMTRCY